jgi:hypothetical protein
LCIGGPLFTWYVSPTEEQLFQKYNPDLQRKSLENRYEKQKDFDDFVGRLKEYSKSDRPSEFLSQYDYLTLSNMKTVWTVQAEAIEQERQAKLQESLRLAEEMKARKEDMRREAGLPPSSKGK